MHADRDRSEPPDIIVPSGHCWRTYAHRPHLFGDPPNTKRCDGKPLVIPTEHDVRAELSERALADERAKVAQWDATPVSPALAAGNCACPPCPGRGNDGHGMTHCAECCFGFGVVADEDCPVHGRATLPGPAEPAPSPSVEDYVRATASANGLDPDAAVSHWHSAIERLDPAEASIIGYRVTVPPGEPFLVHPSQVEIVRVGA